jgi:segregation and condensation protein A
LEYKQYKDAAGRLDDRERLWREVFAREQPVSVHVRADESNMDEVTLFDLVDALQGILKRMPDKRLIEIVPENLTIKDRMNAILELVAERESMTFVSLFEGQQSRLVIIVTFLAMLELIRVKLLRIFQGDAFGPILLTRAFTPVNEQDASSVLDNGWEEP